MTQRDRAWRRRQKFLHNGNGMGCEDKQLWWWPEKDWKLVYLRSEKLKRARQLGFEYPRKSMRQLLEQECEHG